MLYRLIKIPAKLAYLIYSRHIRISDTRPLSMEGPLLICANHPNSLLDAVIISTLFKKPVHSLARGDVFKNKFIAYLLRSINMLPVYRISEGAENLEQNYETFEDCKKIFEKGGIVLIFSEGRCINEWHLRPLKKGTARLAIISWEKGIDLRILPAGLNYNSFHSFGKNIHLNFGNIISKKDINLEEGFGKAVFSFNSKLGKELHPLVNEIKSDDQQAIQNTFYVSQSWVKQLLLILPAIAGYIFHLPLYYAAKKIALKKARDNDHYDSIMVGLLFISYPFYLFIFCNLFYNLSSSLWSLIIFIIAPFSAWSYVQLKKQF